MAQDKRHARAAQNRPTRLMEGKRGAFGLPIQPCRACKLSTCAPYGRKRERSSPKAARQGGIEGRFDRPKIEIWRAQAPMTRHSG
jgi:hypothetical protein